MRFSLLATTLGCIATFAFAPAPAGANGVRLWLEPAHLSVEQLDVSYEDRVGLQRRTAVRVAYGVGLQWQTWTLALQQGHASGHVDFGLLDDTTSRLNRRDTSVELRWMSPELLWGWRLQPAAGLGRLDLRYRPDTVTVVAGGQVLQVGLSSQERWTRHLAAELLHALPGHTQLVLRAAWRRSTLDLASPEGTETRILHDVQAGMAIRVRPF